MKIWHVFALISVIIALATVFLAYNRTPEQKKEIYRRAVCLGKLSCD